MTEGVLDKYRRRPGVARARHCGGPGVEGVSKRWCRGAGVEWGPPLYQRRSSS